MDTSGAADSSRVGVERLLRSSAVRNLGVGLLAWVLQISLLVIGDLVRERRDTKDAAVEQLVSMWSGA